MRAREFITRHRTTNRCVVPRADTLRVRSLSDRPSPPGIPDAESSRVLRGEVTRRSMKADARQD